MAGGLKRQYVCVSCGAVYSKWAGQCLSCQSWNTLEEEIVDAAKKIESKKETVPAAKYYLDELSGIDSIRYETGIYELDRVLGGGIVKGSLILLGGDPGIGKSTLLLQMCQTLKSDAEILYISGEESAAQIKLRADRLGIDNRKLIIATETDALLISELIKEVRPAVAVIDSIQTVHVSELASAAGSAAQIRESAAVLMETAKSAEVPVFLVGHVNKEGSIAGPKILEHTVDVVLYFEGDNKLQYRILRAVKNRYGSTNEIGVFEMSGSGLREIANPSMEFLSDSLGSVPGSSIGCLMEGTRPLMFEIQALISQTPFPSPRRVASGVDYNKLCLLIAVLEKRAGILLYNQDVYLKAAGGLTLDEPAADLAILMALASGTKDFVIGDDTVIIGEVGLAGEVRGVGNIDLRISEANRLGYNKCIIPYKSRVTADTGRMTVYRVRDIREAIKIYI